MIRRAGIHIRLIVAAIILMSASTGAFFAGINMLSTFVQARFDERISFLARYIALNGELGILIGDQEMLTGLAENLLTQQDVVKVVISNNHGVPLADVAADSYPATSRKGKLYQVSAPVKIKNTEAESNPFAFNLKPARQENIIGEVTIYYTVDGINALLAEIKNRFYLLSASLVTVSLVMFALLSRFLVKPVNQLVIAAKKVAQGDLTLRVTPGNLPETRELSEAFNAMLDSLEESNRALEKASREMVRQKTLAELGKFSLMIAHEVKNPLGIIKSSLDLLKQDLNLSSDNTMVNYIEDEIKRMNKLIEEFLEFARPASPTCRQSDMNLLLKECVSRFELQTKGQSVIFHLNLPNQACYLNIDPDLMTRVLNNIIKNAIEMSRGKGSIDITAANRLNDWFCQISDRGPGIPAEDLEKIFEPFYTTRATGTGLGLAFASQVINAHSGSISAENRKDGGACFIITLPGKG